MKKEVKEIPFYGDTLLGIKDESNQVWLVITHSCKELGFDYQRTKTQGEKIREDKILSKGVGKFRVPTKGGEQEVFCLNEKYVPLWLAKIALTKKMERDIPMVVKKLEQYQLEAADVLHKAFYSTPEQKHRLHNQLALEGQISTMFETQKIQTVQINNMENLLGEQMEMLSSVVENMTLSTHQQQQLYKTAKDRINLLLGGAHSRTYKNNAKSYFINLWNELKSCFECGSSYKDLNPKYFNPALDFIAVWEYK